MDIVQIDILKGPQALFFGKNSTAGVVSYRSADPTDDFFATLRLAYESEAKEEIVEIVLSGPLADTLGARLAINYTQMDGFMKNTHSLPVYCCHLRWDT